MVKLFFIVYAIGPALFGWSLAYLLRRPGDWTGPAVMLPITLAMTVATQLLGVKKMERDKESPLRLASRGARIGGLALGVVVFCMAFFTLLDPP